MLIVPTENLDVTYYVRPKPYTVHIFRWNIHCSLSEPEKPTSFSRLDLALSSGGMHIFIISDEKFRNVSETVFTAVFKWKRERGETTLLDLTHSGLYPKFQL